MAWTLTGTCIRITGSWSWRVRVRRMWTDGKHRSCVPASIPSVWWCVFLCVNSNRNSHVMLITAECSDSYFSLFSVITCDVTLGEGEGTSWLWFTCSSFLWVSWSLMLWCLSLCVCRVTPVKRTVQTVSCTPWTRSWRGRWRPSVTWWIPTWPSSIKPYEIWCPRPSCTWWSTT